MSVSGSGVAPVCWHEPGEWAAILLRLFDEHLLGMLSALWPFRCLVAEDVLWDLFVEADIFIEASPSTRPEPAVLVDRSVAEKEVLVGPLALEQVRLQSEVGNLLELIVLRIISRENGRRLSVNFVNHIAFLDPTEYVIGPVDLSAIRVELLLVSKITFKVIRSSKEDLIGSSYVLSFQGAAIIAHLGNVADSQGEGSLVSLSHLLAHCLVHNVLFRIRDVKGLQSVREVGLEEVPLSRSDEAVHTHDIV